MKLGENLNKTFGKVIVKNLREAPKRLNNFKKYADAINLDYEVYDAIYGKMFVPKDYEFYNCPSGWLKSPDSQYLFGYHLSFIGALMQAISKRQSSFIICDDDTEFLDIDLTFIKDHLPEDWDAIQLGTIQNINNNKELSFRKITSPIDIQGSHCVAINWKAYFKILLACFKFNENNDGRQAGKIGDGLYHRLAEDGQINFYQMTPDISRQNRTSLIPGIII